MQQSNLCFFKKLLLLFIICLFVCLFVCFFWFFFILYVFSFFLLLFLHCFPFSFNIVEAFPSLAFGPPSGSCFGLIFRAFCGPFGVSSSGVSNSGICHYYQYYANSGMSRFLLVAPKWH